MELKSAETLHKSWSGESPEWEIMYIYKYVCIEKTIEESNLVMDVRYGKRCLVFWFNYVCVFYPVEIEAIQEALVPRSDSWTQHWKLIAVFAARLLAWRIPRIIINPDV